MTLEDARAVPIFPAQDFDATASFYRPLGFEERGRWPREYLILRSGGVELHFFFQADLDPLANDHGCYVRVGDADALHREWSSADVWSDTPSQGRLVAPVDTDYGQREFAAIDPNGNLIRVGSALEVR
jgi:catechol 2,3-dioxygenase-like lactoylglutathione lyase family enzyme